MFVKHKLVVVLVLVLALAAVVLPGTAAFADDADPVEVCYVTIHIHTYPGIYYPNPIGVETGEYHPHQNCIVIDPN